AGTGKPRERPPRVTGDHRIFRRSKAIEQAKDARIGGLIQRDRRVPESHTGVAHKAAPLGPLDRTPAKHGAEFLLRERGEPFEFRREECFARLERGESRTYGSGKACVGQASRQRVQLPQRSGGGGSPGESVGSKARVVTMTPRKSHDPSCG